MNSYYISMKRQVLLFMALGMGVPKKEEEQQGLWQSAPWGSEASTESGSGFQANPLKPFYGLNIPIPGNGDIMILHRLGSPWRARGERKEGTMSAMSIHQFLISR